MLRRQDHTARERCWARLRARLVRLENPTASAQKPGRNERTLSSRTSNTDTQKRTAFTYSSSSRSEGAAKAPPPATATENIKRPGTGLVRNAHVHRQLEH